MKVIAYYTNDDIYSEHAELLKKSLETNNIPYDIEKIEPSNWLKATAFKPTFIKRKLDLHREPLLYMDIDAIVHGSFKDFFQGIKEDLALYHTPKNELLSGVIYLRPTAKVFKLVDQWIEKMETHPELWDQRALQQLLDSDSSISIFPLPPEYVFIFDTSKELYPSLQPIIEHLQASRETKYREKCRSTKYQILKYLGVRPKIGKYLLNRRKRMKELLSQQPEHAKQP